MNTYEYLHNLSHKTTLINFNIQNYVIGHNAHKGKIKLIKINIKVVCCQSASEHGNLGPFQRQQV